VTLGIHIVIVLSASAGLAVDAVLKNFMGPDGKVRTTAHFEIVNDVPESDLRPLVARLEGTYNAIERFAKAAGFGVGDEYVDEMASKDSAYKSAKKETPLNPPLVRGEAKSPTDSSETRDVSERPRELKSAARLKIALYNSQADFEKHLEVMHISAKSVVGFYDQASNTAVFCNARDHEDVRRIKGEIAAIQAKFREDVRAAGGEVNEVASGAMESSINALRLQQEDVIESYNRFTIQHEAAHQVLFNLGVHALGKENPPWLVEGLATQFEVPQMDRRGRLTGVNQYRLADFREAAGEIATKRHVKDDEIDALFREDRLASLKDLLTDRQFNRNDGAVNVRYAEAWALVYFLEHEHFEVFNTYLHRVQKDSGDELHDSNSSVERELAQFQTAFGAIDEAMQRRFVRFVLKLPLRN